MDPGHDLEAILALETSVHVCTYKYVAKVEATLPSDGCICGSPV